MHGRIESGRPYRPIRADGSRAWACDDPPVLTHLEVDRSHLAVQRQTRCGDRRRRHGSVSGQECLERLPRLLGPMRRESRFSDQRLRSQEDLFRRWEVRRKSWTGYAAIPKPLRCSTGLREPSETLIRASLYQRM